MITYNASGVMQCKCGCSEFNILQCTYPYTDLSQLICSECGCAAPKFLKDVPCLN